MGKVDFKSKGAKRPKEGQHIMIKGLIQQEEITFINIYTPKYVKQILVNQKEGIYSNMVALRDFSIPFL